MYAIYQFMACKNRSIGFNISKQMKKEKKPVLWHANKLVLIIKTRKHVITQSLLKNLKALGVKRISIYFYTNMSFHAGIERTSVPFLEKCVAGLFFVLK